MSTPSSSSPLFSLSTSDRSQATTVIKATSHGRLCTAIIIRPSKPCNFATKPNLADREDWNISSLTCDASGLTGNRAGCWQLTGRDGEGPVTGEFRVNFRESDWTPWLPHDVDAGEQG